MNEVLDTIKTITEVAPATEAVAPVKKSRKKKVKKSVARGIAHIHASFNNTILSLTDRDGNVISWASAGNAGFKGPKKATPYAASIVAKNAVDRVKDTGLKEIDIVIKGVGQGRDSAIRALHANGLKILSIRDITPLPHNGCRPPRPRRV